jgi:hypothetical protein
MKFYNKKVKPQLIMWEVVESLSFNFLPSVGRSALWLRAGRWRDNILWTRNEAFFAT